MPRNPGGTVSGFKLLSTPDAPTITGVTTSIGSASVAFTAPSDTGDGAISSYVVTAVDESSGVSTGATGTSSPISISPGGGTFKIRMQALNPYGPGRLTEYDTGNAIYSGAELYAWGGGVTNSGQLGDNTIANKSSPTQVGALTTWASVNAGSSHSTSIKTNGTLWAWGLNYNGQLGDGSRTYRSSPVQVGALTTWAQTSAGGNFTAAIKTDNTLWTWGSGLDGRLGQSSGLSRSSPVQVGALTNWSTVAAGGFHAVAVKTDGTLWAWGRNSAGQVGDGTASGRNSPVQVGALTSWYFISAGEAVSFAVKTDGTLWAWGAGAIGQLGDNTTVSKSSPIQIGALTNWSTVSNPVKQTHTVAVKTDNTLWSWGQNEDGQLGQGDVVNRSSPVQIGSLANWQNVSAGARFTAAVKTDGTLWTWGQNNGNAPGALGDNTVVSKSSPIQVGALTDWVSFDCGDYHTLALLGVV